MELLTLRFFHLNDLKSWHKSNEKLIRLVVNLKKESYNEDLIPLKTRFDSQIGLFMAIHLFYLAFFSQLFLCKVQLTHHNLQELLENETNHFLLNLLRYFQAEILRSMNWCNIWNQNNIMAWTYWIFIW